MITQADIKRIRSLHEKKFRDSLGLFIVEGEKMVREARDSGLEIVAEYRREDIGEETMRRISTMDSSSPVLALVRRRETHGDDFSGLCVALDAVRDPGNMGTILRVCDWFGVKTVYASADTVELYNPKVVAASMGAIFRVNVVYCDLEDVCRSFARKGLPVYGTFLNGNNIYEAGLGAEGLVVMGNEAHGISDGIAALVSDRLTIPSFGGSESLNVAAATAVTLSEFRRRI